MPDKPSIHFCDTGELDEGEKYHPDLHNIGQTPKERCSEYYTQYSGGKSRKRLRKSKKSKKHRRKSIRRRR